MATNKTDNDAKIIGGYIKEKFTIGLSRISGDECQRAVQKVTSHKLKIPNEKHMLRLIAASYGHFNPGKTEYGDINAWMVGALEERLHTRSWIVVLKTLLVFHRLLHDGSEYICKAIGTNRNLFCLGNMKDVADSPQGAGQQAFITQYTRYLEERAICSQTCGISHRLEAEEFLDELMRKNDVESLVPMDALMLQFEVATALEYRPEAVDNFATLEGVKRMVNDNKRLYVVISKRMLAILDEFTTLEQETKKRWLALYLRYHQCTKQLAKLFEQMDASNRHIGEDLPHLKLLPESIREKLEADVRGVRPDDGVRITRMESLDSKTAQSPAQLQQALQAASMASRMEQPTAAQQTFVQGLDLFAMQERTDAFDKLAESSGDDMDDFFATQEKEKKAQAQAAPQQARAAPMPGAGGNTGGRTMSSLFDDSAPASSSSQQQHAGQNRSLSGLFDPSAEPAAPPAQRQQQQTKPPAARPPPGEPFDPFAPTPAETTTNGTASAQASSSSAPRPAVDDFFAPPQPQQQQQPRQQPSSFTQRQTQQQAPPQDAEGRHRAW